MGANFSRINKQRVITTRSQLDEEINLFLNKEARQALSTNPIDEQYNQLISSFLEIAVGQTVQTATRFLETTNWNIDEAINLFLFDNNYDPTMYHDDHVASRPCSDDSTTSDEEESDSRLSSLYRPPLDLLFEGSFQEAKSTSSQENLWLLVNLQSRTEFASKTLNRDVWSHEAVSETVKLRFMLWQVYDHTTEGQKLSSFYRIECAPPVVLLIDPITGRKMRMWSGVIEAHSFVEDLMGFSEDGPHEHISALTRNRYPETYKGLHICSSRNNTDQVPDPSWGAEFEEEDTWSSSNHIDQVVAPSGAEEFENEETWSSSNNYDQIESAEVQVEEEESWTSLDFPDLTEEPKGDCDRSTVCSLCVRFPDGRRKQRKFLKSESIQLLWSFCYSQMERSERKAFKLVQAIPGASTTLDYGANVTFDQSGLANSMISVTWE